MKRIIFFGLLLVAACAFAQEPIYYNSTPTLKWTPTDQRPDGQPLATGDTVEYRPYASDVDLGDIALLPIGSLDLRATWVDTDPFTADAQGEESIVIDFAYTAVNGWWVALHATHIDGGGNRTDYHLDDVLYSSVIGDVASGIPFVYILESSSALPGAGATGLRDSGM